MDMITQSAAARFGLRPNTVSNNNKILQFIPQPFLCFALACLFVCFFFCFCFFNLVFPYFFLFSQW